MREQVCNLFPNVSVFWTLGPLKREGQGCKPRPAYGDTPIVRAISALPITS
jgi:hypothetical protein